MASILGASVVKWDLRYLELARFLASWSKDPSTQVGAVIADSTNRIVSAGYNGLPRGVHDTLDRLENRELKYQMTVHAEENALLFAGRDVRGCTIYVWPLPPCAPCAAKIIQAGISRVVFVAADQSAAQRWGESNDLALRMFSEAWIAVNVVETGKLA